MNIFSVNLEKSLQVKNIALYVATNLQTMSGILTYKFIANPDWMFCKNKLASIDLALRLKWGSGWGLKNGSGMF
ncbi:hypothetical protein [Chryseobacterium lineare]